MKITRLGTPKALLTSGLGGDAGRLVAPGGADLQVLTSNGSNGRYWGENIRRITANGSNLLLGPDVNFASGSNMVFSVASNTLTLHAILSGGAGSLTVKDEGSTLTTAADTLDFVGAGVVASGAGGTKTITIAGGSGGAARLPLDVAPGSPHAKDDEFDDTSGMSGSGNGLNARWTNPQTSGTGLDLAITYLPDWITFQPNTSGTASTGKRGGFGIRQSAPTGSFTVSAKITDGGSDGGTDDGRTGIFVGRSTATTYTRVIGHQNSVPRLVDLLGVTGYTESAEWSGFDGTNVFATQDNIEIRAGSWFRIVWDSSASTLAYYYSANGVFWRLLTTQSSQTQPDRIGLVIYGNNQDIRADHRLAADWFRVTEP